ncbi:uncharacterized protein LOC117287903 [Asterias rubens]|uniref:uncharacterized protein LOC117287903 n=1 Tax=Asterias rubens TaxID=7604 RepID=UPI0014555A51|nr:uncharacterized protein LOC117287903 [Asterias rubens]XP_033624420.1 uncharacterized protein LOC117287903 [Asterias rubens]
MSSGQQSESWRLGTPELIQQMALLAWMNKAEGGEEFYQLITQARIWYEMYQRISCTDEIDAAKVQTIMAIVDYVKKNPRASQDEMAKEIEKHVQLFVEKIDAL